MDKKDKEQGIVDKVRLSVRGEVLHQELRQSYQSRQCFWGIVGVVTGYILRDSLNCLPKYNSLPPQNTLLARNKAIVFFTVSTTIYSYFALYLNNKHFRKQQSILLNDPANIQS